MRQSKHFGFSRFGFSGVNLAYSLGFYEKPVIIKSVFFISYDIFPIQFWFSCTSLFFANQSQKKLFSRCEEIAKLVIWIFAPSYGLLV